MIIKITTPQALGIVGEIHRTTQALEKTHLRIQQEAQAEWDAYQAKAEEDRRTDLERLRLNLSLPTLENMELTTGFLEVGVAFLRTIPPLPPEDAEG